MKLAVGKRMVLAAALVAECGRASWLWSGTTSTAEVSQVASATASVSSVPSETTSVSSVLSSTAASAGASWWFGGYVVDTETQTTATPSTTSTVTTSPANEGWRLFSFLSTAEQPQPEAQLDLDDFEIIGEQKAVVSETTASATSTATTAPTASSVPMRRKTLGRRKTTMPAPSKYVSKESTPLPFARSKHMILPKTATLRHLSLLFDRLARDQHHSRYLITRIPERMFKLGGVQELAGAYGFKLVAAGRSVVVERRQRQKQQRGKGMVSRLLVEELVREDEARVQASLISRATSQVAVEAESESETEEQEVMAPIPAVHVPHGEKNLKKTQWTRPAKSSNNNLRRIVQEDTKNWRSLVESVSTQSEDEHLDYDDETIDWDHYLEADGYVHPSEMLVEEEDVIAVREKGPRVTRRQTLAPAARPKKAVTRLPKPQTAAKSSTRQPFKRSRVKSRRAMENALRRAEQDWRVLLKERFDPSVSEESDFEYDYEYDYDVIPQQEEEPLWSMAKFFAKDLFPTIPDHPFDMSKFFGKDLYAPLPDAEPFDMSDLFPTTTTTTRMISPTFPAGTGKPEGSAGRGRRIHHRDQAKSKHRNQRRHWRKK